MDGHVDNCSVRYQHPQLAISALLQEPVPDCQLLENSRVAAKPIPSTSYSPTLAPSTSSSVSIIAQVKHATLSKSTQSSVQREESRNSGTISCMNCRTTTTPLWRRDPNSGSHLCNRCGLYLKTYNVMHPLKKIKRRTIGNCAQTKRISLPSISNNNGVQDMDDVEQIPRPANCNPPQLQQLPEGVLRRRRVTPKQQINLGITPHCFNCSAENTPLWRRDPEDNIICNACGLYYKLHGKARPVSMRRSAIKRRNRTTASTLAVVKSTPSTEAGRIVEPLRLPSVANGTDGLDFLMHAAELCSPPTKQNDSTTRNSECSMLESLANVATAEFKSQNIRCYNEDRSNKEKLQQECQRLEQLLAQSRAVLDTMN
ncbi:glucocorticoid receptor-like (DNA-binding domain) [Coemansia reversa NRRL 1564]|uniref:Glucocorticoid receptor-like (DNA-binding domain) n=1 Tax=Coemansia reversa (strain ATCC 12441 / NRRL 1564) TaxID=763665 RepID=A0A2G5BK20_COERN|nr:glucocorticoid receptor-like (DNA-binding domain) [Coemansia reversa NRRL 1564]|eukprot:PIA19087.1 glucocorticoid receptor-like (DNA-binding domain) [Coemansia reversa NRRL 1564]